MVAGKRSLEDGNESTPKKYNQGNQPLLKLLIPNYVAGALIGKGGSLITEMKEKYGGNIRLSANREVYPGTNERIVVLTGENNEIIELNSCIMEKVRNGTSKQPVDDTRRNQVKIVLTSPAAGLLIGRGGLTIKSIQEETKAKLSICNTDKATVPGERVLTMSGSMEECVEASTQIIEKIASDASNMANVQLQYANTMMGYQQQESGLSSQLNSYSSMSANHLSLTGANSMRQSNQVFQSKLKAKVEIQLEVPDALVGPILGRQGSIIRDIVQRSGARLKFNDKNENPTGSKDRILTITANDINSAQIANTLVNERVEEVGDQINVQSY